MQECCGSASSGCCWSPGGGDPGVGSPLSPWHGRMSHKRPNGASVRLPYTGRRRDCELPHTSDQYGKYRYVVVQITPPSLRSDQFCASGA